MYVSQPKILMYMMSVQSSNVAARKSERRAIGTERKCNGSFAPKNMMPAWRYGTLGARGWWVERERGLGEVESGKL